MGYLIKQVRFNVMRNNGHHRILLLLTLYQPECIKNNRETNLRYV